MKKVQKKDQRSILRNPGIVIFSKLSKEELCQHLAQNVVYREGTSEEIYLVSILPDLQQLLEIKPELHIVKSAPKESSGLVLLSTCHVTTKHFEDFYSQCRKAKKPFTTFREQLLVQCTLKLCPILGDHTYNARVGKILGKDTYVPFDLALLQTQRVEEKILHKMPFSSQQMHRMPLHLHLHQLIMPKDPQGRYPTHLQAPPMPFFQRTMELLGLRVQN